MITVYTKPSCVQCEMTKKYLDKFYVQYKTIDIVQDQEALGLILEMGFKSVPVVISDNESWAGFQPDRMNGLIKNAS